MGIKIVLVDDHAVVREGLRAIVEKKAKGIEIIGEAGDAEGALKLAKNCTIDIFVVDIALPKMNGIELTIRLKKLYPQSRVLIISMHDKDVLVEKALQAGASGYVLKESATEDIEKAIYAVFKGSLFLSKGIDNFAISRSGEGWNTEPAQKLTKREREILQLIAEGLTNNEIAQKLHRSENTIHVHRNKLMRKLDLHRQADLVRYALKENISFI